MNIEDCKQVLDTYNVDYNSNKIKLLKNNEPILNPNIDKKFLGVKINQIIKYLATQLGKEWTTSSK